MFPRFRCSPWILAVDCTDVTKEFRNRQDCKIKIFMYSEGEVPRIEVIIGSPVLYMSTGLNMLGRTCKRHSIGGLEN